MTPKLAKSMAQALQCYQRGDLQNAEALLRQILEADPNHGDAWHYLGLIAHQRGRQDEAISCLRRSLAAAPNSANVHCNLGLMLQTAGQLDEAIASYRQALQENPAFPEALSNLGNALTELGRLDEAVVSCERALQIRPDYAQAHNNLAVALTSQGLHAQAVAHCREALRLRPDFAEAHNTWGNALYWQNREGEAIEQYQNAIRMRPKNAGFHCNLGAAYIGQGKLDEAESCLRTALEHKPDFAGAFLNLGDALQQRGNLDDAQACFRDALRLDPNLTAARDNLLLCLNYDARLSSLELLQAHREWGDWASAKAGNPPSPPAGSSTNGRPLRVGYVSPDLRSHSVARFLLPILAHHDPSQVEAHCYAAVATADAVTKQLQSVAAGWRNIYGLNDFQAAELIRADRIDILVDLAGHTANTRLAVFAHKPAPILVTYLGYPCTTGLSAIDYCLTDAVADPPGESSMWTESLIRLPLSFSCYAPPESAPPTSQLPARKNAYVTFGSFHHLAKLNDQVVDLWAAVLKALPQSRLLVFRHTLQGAVRNALLRRLGDRGIASDRVEMHHAPTDGRGHLGMYDKVDISLDAFPWSGHTTACESIWMGVPVITLRGTRHAARMVASVLTMANLEELIADTGDAYVEIATRLANDLERLADLRGKLREAVRLSPLCDGKTFTKSIESAFRTMWTNRGGAGSR